MFEFKNDDFVEKEFVEVIPLKDFIIHMNEFHYELKEGESIEIHKMFLQNLITEKIIKE